MMTPLLLCVLTATLAAPQTGGLCGVGEGGEERVPGESWQEDCNRCRCLSSGIPACTKKLCTVPAIGGRCQDSQGRARQEGERWEESSAGCSCEGGEVSCTQLTVITEERGVVRFPGSRTCTDQGGRTREEGESWAQECNTCSCTQGITACTEIFCVNITQGPGYLLEPNSARDVSKTAQCRQAGGQNCRAVRLNQELLQSLNPGDSINLIQGVDISMKLRRAPTGSPSSTLSYGFSLAGGGEGTVTVRPSTGSVFASIKPASGSVSLTVEACGQGCNTLYERDSQFFNQFQD